MMQTGALGAGVAAVGRAAVPVITGTAPVAFEEMVATVPVELCAPVPMPDAHEQPARAVRQKHQAANPLAEPLASMLRTPP
jgi:hypothetical protein